MNYLSKSKSLLFFQFAICGFVFCNFAAAQIPKSDGDIINSLVTNINYLASDKLEGRLTGSRGEKLAYEFLIDNFQSMNLLPRGENEQYTQTFSFKKIGYRMFSFELNNNKINIVHQAIKPNAYYPLSMSGIGKISGKTIWLNYGISASALGVNDYAGKRDKDLKGKIFVMRLGYANASNAESKIAEFATIERKIDTAIYKGAKAVIFINQNKELLEPDFKPLFKPNFKSVPVYLIGSNEKTDTSWFINAKVNLEIDTITRELEGHNVIGFINNKMPNTVVIGAHYDHLGYNELGGSTYTKTQNEKPQIHNGADDNASGTAALIELSEILAKSHFKNNNYLFIAFSGEEEGLLGSNYFCKNPTLELSKVSYMINMDMLGRLDTSKNSFAINGTGTSPVWNKILPTISIDNLKVKTSEGGTGASDHTSFYNVGIPALHFFTGNHYDYHKPSDDADLINLEGELSVIKYIFTMIGRLDTIKKITFSKTAEEHGSGSVRSFKVTLGIMPDYLFDGKGVKADGVTDGKPASIAGIKRGDIIVKLGSDETNDMQMYLKALNKHNKGDKTKITILRDGKELEMELKF